MKEQILTSEVAEMLVPYCKEQDCHVRANEYCHKCLALFALGARQGANEERQKWQMAVTSLKDIAEHARVSRDGWVEQMAITTLVNLPGEKP